MKMVQVKSYRMTAIMKGSCVFLFYGLNEISVLKVV